MQTPMPLAVAAAQLQQSLADFTASYDAATAKDLARLRLVLGMALPHLRTVENVGMTPNGRKSLRTAIELLRNELVP